MMKIYDKTPHFNKEKYKEIGEFLLCNKKYLVRILSFNLDVTNKSVCKYFKECIECLEKCEFDKLKKNKVFKCLFFDKQDMLNRIRRNNNFKQLSYIVNVIVQQILGDKKKDDYNLRKEMPWLNQKNLPPKSYNDLSVIVQQP